MAWTSRVSWMFVASLAGVAMLPATSARAAPASGAARDMPCATQPASSPAGARARRVSPPPVTLELFVFGGWRRSEQGELFASFAGSGYLADRSSPALGLVVVPYLGRLRIPLRFERSWQSIQAGSHETLLTSLHFGAGLGWDWRLLDALSVGPFAELDYATTHVAFERERPALLASKLAGGAAEVELSKRSAAAELGVFVSSRIWGGPELGERGKPVRAGLLVTTQIGYRIDLAESDWTEDERQLGPAPALDQSGVFVRFGIGIATSNPGRASAEAGPARAPAEQRPGQ